MLTIGVDAHKGAHVAVALDETGQVLDQWRGPNSPDGWADLAAWARARGRERRWGIEGAWNYGRGLAQHLVAAGEVVCEVNTRWTAQERGRARNRSKSDTRDAQAVALYVWREGAALPRVTADDATAVLAVLVAQRDAAVAEATRLRNQAHHLLLQLDPTYRSQVPALTTPAGIAALEHYQPSGASPLAAARAAAVRLLGQRLRLATEHAAALKGQIEAHARLHCAPLIRLKGIDALTAGMLAAHLGPGRRFRTDADLALYAGIAPLEVSSAGRVRHRLNRGGNRQLNAIFYRIALSQVRCWPAAQAYVARRLSEGKTKREAIRALKRHLVRVVWQLWGECVPAPRDDARQGATGPVPRGRARRAEAPRLDGRGGVPATLRRRRGRAGPLLWTVRPRRRSRGSRGAPSVKPQPERCCFHLGVRLLTEERHARLGGPLRAEPVALSTPHHWLEPPSHWVGARMNIY